MFLCGKCLAEHGNTADYRSATVLRCAGFMPVTRWQRGRITGTEGLDFVTCRICGDRRRVISGRHLSKHDSDGVTYMDEYELSPDELIAKAFRVIQSGRAAYEPYGKRQWITAIQKFYRQKGSVWATDLQHSKLQLLYSQGVWIYGDWYSAVAAAGLHPERLGLHTFWNKDRVSREIRELKRRHLPNYPIYVMRNHPGTILGCKPSLPLVFQSPASGGI